MTIILIFWGNFDLSPGKTKRILFLLRAPNLSFICYSGLTRGRRKPCSATLTPSTNLLQTLTGSRSVCRSSWGPCTRTGTTPSSTTSTSSRRAWSRPTGRRRSLSSTSPTLTGRCYKSEHDAVMSFYCPATVNAGQKTLFCNVKLQNDFLGRNLYIKLFVKMLRVKIQKKAQTFCNVRLILEVPVMQNWLHKSIYDLIQLSDLSMNPCKCWPATPSSTPRSCPWWRTISWPSGTSTKWVAVRDSRYWELKALSELHPPGPPSPLHLVAPSHLSQYYITRSRGGSIFDATLGPRLITRAV